MQLNSTNQDREYPILIKGQYADTASLAINPNPQAHQKQDPADIVGRVIGLAAALGFWKQFGVLFLGMDQLFTGFLCGLRLGECTFSRVFANRE